MAFQLWDLESGNAIVEYATEVEMLALVRRTVDQHGEDAALPWVLTHTRGDQDETVAEGAALIDLAFGRATAATE